jgi:hypothetical protein
MRVDTSVLDHLRGSHPGFAQGRRGRGLTRRLRKIIHVVDSTVIQLVANCMDWAKHRPPAVAGLPRMIELDLLVAGHNHLLIGKAKSTPTVEKGGCIFGERP